MRALLLLVLVAVLGPAAPAWAQSWRWPLDGAPAVSRSFAAPAHRYAAGHRGADLPSAPGAVVRAAGGGVVSYAGMVAGRGVLVVVHGDLRTTYEPVAGLVEVGSPVAAGEVVGTVEPGHLGCPAPACLHWGLRRGDEHLDPVRLVRPSPVRLLPLGGPAQAAAPRAARVPPGPAAGGAPAVAVVAGTTAGGAAAGTRAGGAAVGGGRRVLAPAAARTPAPALPRPAVVGLAAGAASLLGAAAVRAVRRRRSA